MNEIMLPRVTLGRTGLSVASLGYGSMGIRGPKTWGVRTVDDEHAEKILNAVLDMGINLIDTAPVYGVSEERIGRFLSHRRSEFYLATKCGSVATQHKDHVEIEQQWRQLVYRRYDDRDGGGERWSDRRQIVPLVIAFLQVLPAYYSIQYERQPHGEACS